MTTRNLTMTTDDPRHGTNNGYVNLRCRCPRCRAEWARVTADRRRRRVPPPPGDPRHGVEHTYTNYGCRCQPCTTAHTNASRRRDARRRAAKAAA